MEEAYSTMIEEEERANQAGERNRLKTKIIAEIEEAVSLGFIVQDKTFPENVYVVTNDMKEGEFIPVPKADLAEVFAENEGMYKEWEAEFTLFREGRAEEEKRFRLPFGGAFSKYRRKKVVGENEGN